MISRKSYLVRPEQIGSPHCNQWPPRSSIDNSIVIATMKVIEMAMENVMNVIEMEMENIVKIIEMAMENIMKIIEMAMENIMKIMIKPLKLR